MTKITAEMYANAKKVGADLLYEDKITHKEYICYRDILEDCYTNQKKVCSYSVNQFSVPKNDVSGCTRKLKRLGLIDVRRRNNQSNLYFLSFDENGYPLITFRESQKSNYKETLKGNPLEITGFKPQGKGEYKGDKGIFNQLGIYLDSEMITLTSAFKKKYGENWVYELKILWGRVQEQLDNFRIDTHGMAKTLVSLLKGRLELRAPKKKPAPAVEETPTEAPAEEKRSVNGIIEELQGKTSTAVTESKAVKKNRLLRGISNELTRRAREAGRKLSDLNLDQYLGYKLEDLQEVGARLGIL